MTSKRRNRMRIIMMNTIALVMPRYVRNTKHSFSSHRRMRLRSVWVSSRSRFSQRTFLRSGSKSHRLGTTRWDFFQPSTSRTKPTWLYITSCTSHWGTELYIHDLFYSSKHLVRCCDPLLEGWIQTLQPIHSRVIPILFTKLKHQNYQIQYSI